jgi:hypothetical protein
MEGSLHILGVVASVTVTVWHSSLGVGRRASISQENKLFTKYNKGRRKVSCECGNELFGSINYWEVL